MIAALDDSLLFPLALAALLVSDVLLVVLTVYVYRRMRVAPTAAVPAAPAAPPEAELLRQDLRGLAAALSVLGQRVARVEELLERQQERNVQAAGGRSETERRAYEIATRLAARGAEAGELMDLCGLSRGEAELILRVHGSREDARAVPG